MPNFKRAIIYLDGTSSRIIRRQETERNIAEALSALGIPYEFYKNKRTGFGQLRDDMNQPDTLYVLNDSIQYHLCEKPHILICRSINWVQSTVKPSTIGKLTQEMVALNSTEMVATIARNKPVRQEFDHRAAHTYLLYNDYPESTSDTIGRNGGASFSWMMVSANEIHLEFCPYEEDGFAYVNQMLALGLEKCTHPDDIVILLNRDICLVPESIAIIRAFMDSRNIDACFAQRVDIQYQKALSFWDIAGMPHYEGIDLFAFRPTYAKLPELTSLDLRIGSEQWDNFWANVIQCRIPYNICYHFPHTGQWQTEKGMEGNLFNRRQIASVDSEVIVEGYKGMCWYKRKP